MAGYLEIAQGEVGYRGSPENYTKYWADLNPSYQGLDWCGAFVSWCLNKAGSLGAIGGSPMYYVPSMVTKAREMGQWTSTPSVGALGIYDFGSGIAAHVDFIVGVGSGVVETIGGNTTGDLVARKFREMSSVLGFWDIQATPGSVTPGVGSGIGSGGQLVAAPVQTIFGESAESAARFATNRMVN